MEIQHQTDRKRSSFFIDKEGERLAEKVNVMAALQKMKIEHTVSW